jgi:uroporphyrinogen decarboxylase
LQKLPIHYFIFTRKKQVDAVQVFDSWGGMLSPVDYQEFWKYINQIIEALADHAQ